MFCGGLFWSIMFVVVLLIYGVDIQTVVLPYVSLLLAFSFSFGPTLRRLLESAILVLVITPFEVGDRIKVKGTDGVIIVDRITLFNTIGHRTTGEYVEVSNSKITNNEVANHHRSFPYCFFLSMEIRSDTIESAVVAKLIKHTKLFCESSPTFLGNPSVWLDNLPDANTVVVKFHIHTRSTPWAVPPKWRNCRTEFLNFMHGQEKELGLRFSYPTQPVSLLDK
tara:strand:- start:164 stop:832 length:669 start_codon:yes stop_codon:yes gene_type:complete